MFGMGRPVDREGRIFSDDLLAKAMRDSGYKNTAYALAELIDNSVQAGSTVIEVIGIEERQKVQQRARKRLSQVGVYDNGCGMDADVLRAALMFGNGTHLDDRSGIGRFGMGLPNASFSQATRFEVWSWQDGITNSLWTYLDLKEILDGEQKVVPKPTAKKIPKEWRDRFKTAPGDSGTFVLWSSLDETRLTWKQARATLENTEEIVGRIYRRFIANKSIELTLRVFEEDNPTYDKPADVNDPMYLLSPSATPAPFDKTPMFKKWGDDDEEFKVTLNNNETHSIIVRFSYADQETVTRAGTQDRGNTSYGRHAGKNIGLSLMRADRELELDKNWAIGYDPRERWWGCEVEFPPELDEYFGVTINKQAATLWSQFAQLEWNALADESETSSSQVIERLRMEHDPRGILLDVAEYIRRQLKQIRDAIIAQNKGRREQRKRHELPTTEQVATEKINERAKERPTAADEQDFGKNEAKQLETDLVDNKKYAADVAKDIVKTVWEKKLRLIFITDNLDGHAFFKVEEKPGGISEVIINRNHPFYEKLYETLNPDEIMPETGPEERLEIALSTLRLMFAAWARYEQEATAKERTRLDDVRQDWGRMARFFLADED